MNHGAARRPTERVEPFPQSVPKAFAHNPVHLATAPIRADYRALLRHKIRLRSAQLTVSNRKTRVMICVVVRQLVLTDERRTWVRFLVFLSTP
jgi:hypothetical protein